MSQSTFILILIIIILFAVGILWKMFYKDDTEKMDEETKAEIDRLLMYDLDETEQAISN